MELHLAYLISRKDEDKKGVGRELVKEALTLSEPFGESSLFASTWGFQMRAALIEFLGAHALVYCLAMRN
jgi:hypothetical protein